MARGRPRGGAAAMDRDIEDFGVREIADLRRQVDYLTRRLGELEAHHVDADIVAKDNLFAEPAIQRDRRWELGFRVDIPVFDGGEMGHRQAECSQGCGEIGHRQAECPKVSSSRGLFTHDAPEDVPVPEGDPVFDVYSDDVVEEEHDQIEAETLSERALQAPVLKVNTVEDLSESIIQPNVEGIDHTAMVNNVQADDSEPEGETVEGVNGDLPSMVPLESDMNSRGLSGPIGTGNDHLKVQFGSSPKGHHDYHSMELCLGQVDASSHAENCKYRSDNHVDAVARKGSNLALEGGLVYGAVPRERSDLLTLPSHVRTSDVFKVKHLILFQGASSDTGMGSDSRTNLFDPGGDDADRLAKNQDCGEIAGLELPVSGFSP